MSRNTTHPVNSRWTTALGVTTDAPVVAALDAPRVHVSSHPALVRPHFCGPQPEGAPITIRTVSATLLRGAFGNGG